jgi:hypothetical protein
LGVVLYQLILGGFSQPVTMDWERRIDDELLRQNLAACFAGAPHERLDDVGDLAVQLRSLEKRQATLAAKNKAAQRRQRIKKGLWATAFIATLTVVLFSAVWVRPPRGLVPVTTYTTPIKVESLDIVNRTLDRSEVKIGIVLEYEDKMGTNAMIGVEVSKRDQPETIQYFASGPKDIKPGHNEVILHVRFVPPRGAIETIETDRLQVYWLNRVTSTRQKVSEYSTKFVWRAPKMVAPQNSHLPRSQDHLANAPERSAMMAMASVVKRYDAILPPKRIW